MLMSSLGRFRRFHDGRDSGAAAAEEDDAVPAAGAACTGAGAVEAAPIDGHGLEAVVSTSIT